MKDNIGHIGGAVKNFTVSNNGFCNESEAPKQQKLPIEAAIDSATLAHTTVQTFLPAGSENQCTLADAPSATVSQIEKSGEAPVDHDGNLVVDGKTDINSHTYANKVIVNDGYLEIGGGLPTTDSTATTQEVFNTPWSQYGSVGTVALFGLAFAAFIGRKLCGGKSRKQFQKPVTTVSDKKLKAAVTTIQKMAPGHVARVDFAKKKAAVTTIQKMARGHLARVDFAKKKAAVTTIQKMARGHLARNEAKAVQANLIKYLKAELKAANEKAVAETKTNSEMLKKMEEDHNLATKTLTQEYVGEIARLKGRVQDFTVTVKRNEEEKAHMKQETEKLKTTVAELKKESKAVIEALTSQLANEQKAAIEKAVSEKVAEFEGKLQAQEAKHTTETAEAKRRIADTVQKAVEAAQEALNKQLGEFRTKNAELAAKVKQLQNQQQEQPTVQIVESTESVERPPRNLGTFLLNFGKFIALVFTGQYKGQKFWSLREINRVA